MKKIVMFLKNNLFNIIEFFLICITILIVELFVSEETQEIIDNIITIIGFVIIIFIVIFIIYIKIKEKKKLNILSEKIGYENTEIINKFIKEDFNKEINNNLDTNEFFENIQYTCQEFINNSTELSYTKHNYNIDLKKINKYNLQDLDSYIKETNKIFGIISIYYDNNGIRKDKIKLIDKSLGKEYGKLIKRKLQLGGFKKYEIRFKDNLYRIIVYDKVWIDDYKEYSIQKENAIETWKEDKSSVHIIDNLEEAVKIGEELIK